MKKTSNDPPTTAIEARQQRDKSRLSQPLQAAVGVSIWGDFAGAGADATAVAADLRARTSAIQAGDMRPIEAALLGQAETLGTMFTNLHLMAKRAKNPEQLRVLLTLALKAQAQSRATLETLVETRRPRQLLIARQANIAQQQVVTNGDDLHGGLAACAQASAVLPNKLIEKEPHGYVMDAGEARQTVSMDSREAAMDRLNRTSDTRGQGHRVKERIQRSGTAPAA